MNKIVFDVGSKRRKDENGFLHVESCHISKQTVNPYYGHEIPQWDKLGLESDRIYWGYRCGKELAAGAFSFNGLPLLSGHHYESAVQPCKEQRVGSLGSDTVFISPYLNSSLTVTDAKAIEAIEKGWCRQLSAAYMFDPVFKSGIYEGQSYDFVMTNIRGNHVALVEEGRAGPEVAVADGRLAERRKNMGIIDKIKALIASSEIEKNTINNMDTEPDEVNGMDLSITEDQQQIYEELLELALEINDPDLQARMDNILERLALSIGLDDSIFDYESLSSGLTANDYSLGNTSRYGCYTSGGKKLNKANRRLKRLYEAARRVRPLIGEIDHMAFDSAEGIYNYALRSRGFNPKTKNNLALEEMVELLKQNNSNNICSVRTNQELDGHFSHLARIKL